VSFDGAQDERGIPVDNLDTAPIGGPVRFRRPRDEFFGGPRSRDYESAVVESPTWLDICGLAEDSIDASRDRHHIFLENVRVVGQEDGVQIAEFWMGS
jgi:hypothetical protein